MKDDATSIWRTLGWAAYLGMSWTWCIGMFLPVLLMRDFGVWAFAVFAIPNVVGAAAMGWVLRRPGAADELRRTHASATTWFALVTCGFHVFWFFWLSVMYGFPMYAGVGIGAAILLGATKWTAKRDPDRTLLAAIVLVVSLVAIAVLFAMGWQKPLTSSPLLPTRDLWWLAPVCVFGFALCPYLDPTFLQARSSAPLRMGTAAFVIGFGVLFFAMILFTFAYAGYVRTSRDDPSVIAANAPIAALLGAHWFTQIVFTIHVQVREAVRTVKGHAPDDAPKPRAKRRTRWVALLFMILFVTAIMYVPAYRGLSLGEVIYRLFMSFYGLVFPAYVWLCMIPTRDGHAGTAGGRGTLKLRVLWTALALAAPCYWMGFIERETWWLAPGLGVVLLARLFIRGTSISSPTHLRGGM